MRRRAGLGRVVLRATGWRTGRWRVRVRARARARDVAAALERLGRGGSGTRGCVSRRPGRGAWAGQASGVHRSEAGGRGTGLPRGARKEKGRARPACTTGKERGKGKKKKRKGKENGKEKWREKKRGRERDPSRDHGADRGAGRPRLASGRARARRAGRGEIGCRIRCRVLGESGDLAEQGRFRKTGVRVSRRDLELNDEAKF